MLAAVCFVLPQVVIANSLLHHFYVQGALLYDAGWFAYWTTHALTEDVRGRFSVANPHRNKDDLNGGGIAIAKIAWRE
ncbi:MAG: hypothetical protein OXI59_13765 [Gemmatimonadota bacterium]|nr:hypothetical protein [Gemmatimonadota bacterium]